MSAPHWSQAVPSLSHFALQSIAPGHDFEFGADGSCRHASLDRGAGTYRFVGDDKIETTILYDAERLPPGMRPEPTKWTYQVRVNDKELILFDLRIQKTYVTYQRQKK